MKIAILKNLPVPVEDFKDKEHEVYVLDTVDELIKKLPTLNCHLIFLPKQDSAQSTAKVIDHIKALLPQVYLIILTNRLSVEETVFLVKHGADDIWVVPTERERFTKTVDWLEEVLFPKFFLEEQDRPIIAVSTRMRELIQLARRVASSDASVFIQGESGTGKELIARYIHRNSPRRHGPFVAVNCAAIPENLLESELFGYERGAFTGATRQKPGKFELAKGGTILLDEITEMPLHLQAKLLRVLQEKEVERLGGTRPIPLNVRVIATTNVLVEERVKEGSFRKDLYYRLNVMPIKIPPLRERPEDIVPIAEHVLAEIARGEKTVPKRLSRDAKEKLKKYPWPGNVRELENVIHRAHIIAPSQDILPQHIIFDEMPDQAGTDTEQLSVMSIREMERRLIYRALKASNGNRTKAAEILGITVRTLRNKLKEYKELLNES